MKKFLTGILMLCMVFSLCACGNSASSDTEKDTEKQNTQADSQAANDSESEETESEEGVVYKITVVDEGNNPIEGAMVQLCKESCMPKLTDANGVAEFSVDEVSDEYHANVTKLPDGYVYEDGEVYFENGETEVTFVVKAVQ